MSGTCFCVAVICQTNGSGFPVAAVTGCLMVMLKTTGGAATDTYCPENYCNVGYVWSSAGSGKCERKGSTSLTEQQHIICSPAISVLVMSQCSM